MGSTEPYDAAAGRRYRVRWRDKTHKQKEKRGFRTKRDAELYLSSVSVRMATGEYIDPGLARATVGQRHEAWLNAKKATLKPSAYRVLEPRTPGAPFARSSTASRGVVEHPAGASSSASSGKPGSPQECTAEYFWERGSLVSHLGQSIQSPRPRRDTNSWIGIGLVDLGIAAFFVYRWMAKKGI